MEDLVLSPSSLNLFDKSPALWVAKQYYGVRTAAGEFALRGNYVEEALNQYLSTEKSIEEIAGELYSKLPHHPLCEMFTQCLDFERGTSLSKARQQVEITTEVDGVKFRGFLDYLLPSKHIDLKTVNKLPALLKSKARLGQLPSKELPKLRQQYIYKLATGLPQNLLFVSAEDYYLHEIQDTEFEKAAISVSNIIQNMKDLHAKDDILAETVPDMDRMMSDPWVDSDSYEKIGAIYAPYL